MNPLRWVAQVVVGLLRSVVHPRGGWGYQLLNNTMMNYQAVVRPDASSIVVACVRWVQRTFTEAPPILELWVQDRSEWEQYYQDGLHRGRGGPGAA